MREEDHLLQVGDEGKDWCWGREQLQGDKLESPVRGSEIFSVIGSLYTLKN